MVWLLFLLMTLNWYLLAYIFAGEAFRCNVFNYISNYLTDAYECFIPRAKSVAKYSGQVMKLSLKKTFEKYILSKWRKEESMIFKIFFIFIFSSQL